MVGTRAGLALASRPGASGRIAAAAVAEAAPDGYTLLFTSPADGTPHRLYTYLPFEPVRQFTARIRISHPISLRLIPESASEAGPQHPP